MISLVKILIFFFRFTGPSSYRSIGLAENGKLYCAPHNKETRVLEIDPETSTVQFIGDEVGEGYIAMAKSSRNGCFYAPPGGDFKKCFKNLHQVPKNVFF